MQETSLPVFGMCHFMAVHGGCMHVVIDVMDWPQDWSHARSRGGMAMAWQAAN